MGINDILDKAGSHLVVGRAYGTPVEKDGTMIIPVAFVAGGGGGGQGSDEKANQGEGGGFGGVVYPIGVYAIREDKVRFIPSVNVTRIIMGVLFLVRLAVKTRMRVAVVKGHRGLPGHRARSNNH
jgi:uncharacterized spore protein YtfJ